LNTDEFKKHSTGKRNLLTGQSRPRAGGWKLYSLRDVTGTVPSIPLIASSIMSKKIAQAPMPLCWHVKVGKGGVHGTLEDARKIRIS